MKAANPYLNFKGNTREAFEFYKSVFGGEFQAVLRFRDFGDNGMGVAEKDLDKIKRDQQVVIHCQAGDRSAIGYSLLRKHGFKNVKNYPGGISEWVNRGNPVVTEN